MNIKDNKNIWADVKQTRFFLISDDQEISSGDFEIHTIDGKKKKVNLKAVESFEVTQQEAKAWLTSCIDNVPGLTQLTVYIFLKEKQSTDEQSSDVEAGPGVRLFSALTSETISSIQTEPKASVRGVQKLGRDLKDLFLDYISTDEKRQKAAHQKMEELKNTLQDHGINTSASEEFETQKKNEPFYQKELPKNKPVHEQGSEFSKSDPGEVFRQRLNTILEDVVGKLENLADEVIPEREKNKSSKGSSKD